jgi:hypothetical protein
MNSERNNDSSLNRFLTGAQKQFQAIIRRSFSYWVDVNRDSRFRNFSTDLAPKPTLWFDLPVPASIGLGLTFQPSYVSNRLTFIKFDV